jgi:hypothetical protein
MLNLRTPARLLVAAWASVAAVAQAQTTDTLDLTTVGRDARWKVVGRTTSAVSVKGQRALQLSEGSGMGVMWLDGYEFTDGVIEVDILGRSVPVQGSFVGIAFRVVDAQTHDAVYFRPFNFSADSARRAHSVQYVSHPRWSWRELRSSHPGAYESAITPAADGDEWLHVRVVVRRPTVSVFVNGSPAASLSVEELGDRAGGSVGVWVGEGSGGHFANLRITRAPSGLAPSP